MTEPEFASGSGVRKQDLRTCYGCGAWVAYWTLDDDDYGPCCTDDDHQAAVNRDGFAAARAALTAARAEHLEPGQQ